MANKRYQDPMLTNVSRGWSPQNHINEIIMPVLSVKKPSAKIGVYGADNLRVVTTIKSDEGETPVVTSTPTQADAYLLEPHAVKAFASDAEAENEDAPFDTQRDKAELTTDILSVGREIALAQTLGSTSIISQNATLSGNDQWDVDHADSTPITDIRTAVATVADAMKVPETQLVCIAPPAVRRALQSHSTLISKFQYTQSDLITLDQLAKFFGVAKFLSPDGIYNSAADGQTDDIDWIWGNNFIVCAIASVKLKTRGLGFTCKRKASLVTDKWYDNDRQGWWIRNSDEFDQYLLDTTAAYLIKDAV